MRSIALSITAAACPPGRDGVPDSLPGRVLCGQYGIDASHLWQYVTEYAPLLAALAVIVIAVRLVWASCRVLAWWHPPTPPRWLEITPPVTATPEGTLALWRLLAGALPAARPWRLVPAHVAWEVYATRRGVRCGIWVPPGIGVNAVRAVVQRAWPGARITDSPPPDLPDEGSACALRLTTGQPEWMPLLDEDALPTNAHRSGHTNDAARGVYGALVSAGRMRAGWLQIIVTRAPARRRAVLRKATRHPDRATGRRHPAMRLLLVLLDGVAAVARTVLDLVGPGHHDSSHTRHHHRLRHDRGDPWVAEQRRQARIRHSEGPHFLVAIRTAAAGPDRSAARAGTADIASGYALISTELRTRRLFLPRLELWTRWAPQGHFLLATAAELATLAGLPAEPSLYGLPAAAARSRPPAEGTWHATTPPTDPN